MLLSMLDAIEAYLKRHGRACLADLCAHLQTDAGALLPMLELLEARGRIRRVPVRGKDCGACGQCDPAVLSMWVPAADARDVNSGDASSGADSGGDKGG
jgi:hypothetical protein